MFYFNLLWFNIYRLSSSVYLFVVDFRINCKKFCYAQLSFIKWNNITRRRMYLFSLLFLLPLPVCVCVCVKIIGSLTRIWPSYKNLFVTIYQVECSKFLIFPCSSFYLLSFFFLFSSFSIHRMCIGQCFPCTEKRWSEINLLFSLFDEAKATILFSF